MVDSSQNFLLIVLQNYPEIFYEVVTKILPFIDHQIVPGNFPKFVPKIVIQKHWAYAIHIPIFSLHLVAQSDCNLPKDPCDLRCASIILCLDSRHMGFNCFKFKCCITNCETCKWRPYF